jgi:arsenate reductase
MGPRSLVRSGAGLQTLLVSLFEILQTRRAKVLFVCLGNSCRSQMAEAFARTFGSDVMEASSAGIQPAYRISRKTRAVMDEKQVPLTAGQAPKNIGIFNLSEFDLIVSLSEYGIPKTDTMVLKLPIPDPMGHDDEMHRQVRDEVEYQVQMLAEHFRLAREWNSQLYSVGCAQASSSQESPRLS